MNKKKNILIVGGTGFIGYHLAKIALKKGFQVTSLSSKKPKKLRKLVKVKYILCDISKKKILENKLKKKNYDYVVNLGGYVDHTNKTKTFDSHYNGCKNLANIFLKKNIISFVQIGSSVEYGNHNSPQVETLNCNPIKQTSTYGKAKLLSTLYLLKLYEEYKFPVTILRLYLSYGPRQDINRFLPIIINGCINNLKFPCSTGSQYRDFIHVKDVVRAIFKSLTNRKARGQIFNVGSGKPHKLKSIILLIRSILKGGKPEFGKIKLRKDEIKILFPNIQKIKTKLNWRPTISFNQGIKSTIKDFQERTFHV